MSYYNPYLDDLKDERIEIIEEKLIGDTKHIYAVLHRKDVCNCPNCSSIHTISYGKRKRLINCDLFAHYKTNFVFQIVIITKFTFFISSLDSPKNIINRP